MADGTKSGSWWVPARFAVCLVLLCLYVRYRVEPHIGFPTHPGFPNFYTNTAFLREFVSYPGGLATYVSGFLLQACSWAWGGPLVITAIVGLICWCTDVLIVAMGGSRVRGLAFVPAIVLIPSINAVFGQLALFVTLLAALLGLVFYLGLAAGGEGRRIAVFAAVGALLYYVAGGAFLFFGLLAALFELFTKPRRLPALVCLLSLEAVPYVAATYLFTVSLADAYAEGLPLPGRATMGPVYWVAACYGFLLALTLGLGLWGLAAARKGRPAERKGGRATRRRRDRPLVGSLALLVLGVLAALATFDANAHRVIRVDYFTWREDWEGVLREARGLPPQYYTEVVNQHVNLALYETGRLGDEMFAYPQRPTGLMLDSDLGRTVGEQTAKMGLRTDLWFQLGDLDLRLGLANESEHEAHEALAMHGPHPEVLKRLALVNLAKGQPDAARVFLNALRYSPLHRTRTEAVLRRMATDPYLRDDAFLNRVRSAMLTRDHPFPHNALDQRCLGLLQDHPQNRMAFEYLMAWYLLNRDLAAFARQLPRLKTVGYRTMPCHYQQAVLLYEKETTRASDRAGYSISPDVLQEFADFIQALQATDSDAAALAERFGDTYLFYYVFGITGAMVQP
ncbi:MAG: hypothetical protein FJX75_21860 [Armatimonadetes bacterium]|nr:hypothetical protein [Armatimonadota bacterium]